MTNLQAMETQENAKISDNTICLQGVLDIDVPLVFTNRGTSFFCAGKSNSQTKCKL